jgi:hypothetical protein
VVGVAIEGVMTLLEVELMRWAGATPTVAAVGGAATGVVALLLIFSGAESPPHKELLELVRLARARAAQPVGARAATRVTPDATATGVAAAGSPSRMRPAFRDFAPAIPSHDRLAPRAAAVALMLVAPACGAIASREPRLAAGVLAVGGALLLAHRAPALHLLALLALTTIVPLELQARLGSGGSVYSAGILPSDLLLLTGLARALVVLPRQPIGRFSIAAAALTAVFVALAAAQLAHALGLGRPVSGAGGEFRALLGFGTLLVALPIVADARQRRTLMTGLAWVGLVLGCWGCAQFALHLRFTDVDVPLDAFQTAGRVVGLFAFPAAATLALAALTGGSVRGSGARALFAAILVANVAAIVLTFERTFILVTLIGFALVFLRGTPRQRLQLAMVTPAVAVTTVLGLGVLAPAALSAYGQRLATLTEASADPAIQYRVAESRMVESEIRARPVSGSGLGATILIGRPGTNTPPAPRRHAENGYLWLAWKAGIPAALVMCLLLVMAVAGPPTRSEGRDAKAVRRGFQAALATIAVASLSFPSFNQMGITAAMGVLIAGSVAARLDTRPLPGTGTGATA